MMATSPWLPTLMCGVVVSTTMPMLRPSTFTEAVSKLEETVSMPTGGPPGTEAVAWASLVMSPSSNAVHVPDFSSPTARVPKFIPSQDSICVSVTVTLVNW